MRRAAVLAALAVLLGTAAAQADPPAPAASQQGGPTYYLGADQIEWNYAPSGVNLCTGEAFDGEQGCRRPHACA